MPPVKSSPAITGSRCIATARLVDVERETEVEGLFVIPRAVALPPGRGHTLFAIQQVPFPTVDEGQVRRPRQSLHRIVGGSKSHGKVVLGETEVVAGSMCPTARGVRADI